MILEEKGIIPEWIKPVLSGILEILKKYRIEKAWLFGSVLRTEKYNDIDILIDPPEGFSLFDLSGLALEIEDLTGKPVDIVTRRSLDQMIAEYVRGVRIL